MKYYFRLALLFSLIVIGKLTKEAKKASVAVKVSPVINPIPVQLASFFQPIRTQPDTQPASSRM